MVSSGIDWGTSVRPLLAASYGNVSVTDLLKLARSIQHGQEELQSHGPEHMAFYSSFVALSTHFLSGNVCSIPRSQLSTVSGACRVLAEYLIKGIDISSDQCAVTPPQFILLVKSLCSGVGCLHRSDIITLAAQMKSSQLPSHIRSSIGPEKATEEDTGIGASGLPRQRTQSASRNDPLGQMVDLLATPLQDHGTSSRWYSGEEKELDRGKEQSGKSKEQFATENIQILIRLNAASVLLDLCLQLPHVGSFSRVEFEAVRRGELLLPSAETPEKDREAIANSLSAFNSEVDLVAAVLELHLWDGASIDILEKLSAVLCGCVLGSGIHLIERHLPTSSSSETKKDGLESDSTAFVVLQQVLASIAPSTKNVFRHSMAGQTALQNLRALESVCAGAIVKHLIGNFALSVGILEFAEHLQGSVALLLKDASSDVSGKTQILSDLSVKSVCSPAQRLAFISKNIHIVPLLLQVALLSLQMATKNMEETPENPVGSLSADFDAIEPLLSPSAVHAEPPLIDADPVTPTAPSAESDSEPLFGTWLEELLSSVPHLDVSSKKKQTVSRQLSRRRSTATESAIQGGSLRDTTPSNKKLIGTSVDCLRLLADRLLGGNGSIGFLRSHVSAVFLSSEIGQLVSLIEILDKQDQTHSSDSSFGEVNTIVSKLVHNLLVNQYLLDSMQDMLVEKLVGQSLHGGQGWALRLNCRALAVFGQLMLLRLHRESGDFGKSGSELLIVEIWERFLRTLKNAVVDMGTGGDESKYDLVNVEHIQLLLVMFHSLQLIQKKTVLLMLAQVLIEVAEQQRRRHILEEIRSPHFGVLLSLLEYMMKHYYEAPNGLMEQVRNNIYPVQTRMGRGGQEKSNVKTILIRTSGARQYFPWSELEDAWSKLETNRKGKSFSPVFYNLCPLIWADSDGPPKLCGLGMKTLMASDLYDRLYESCIQFLSADVRQTDDNKLPSNTAVLSAYFIRSLVWRILGELPVSDTWLNGVVSGSLTEFDGNSLVHFLRIGGRFASETEAFRNWQKEWWNKQGLSTEDSHNDLLNSTSQVWADKDKINFACLRFLESKFGETHLNIGFATALHIYVVLCVLRSNVNSEGVDDAFNDEPEFKRQARAKDRECFETLAKLTQWTHQNANKLVISEVRRENPEFPMSKDAAMCLLDLATTSFQQSVAEADYSSLFHHRVFPSPIANTIGVWWNTGDQFINESITTFKENRAIMNEEAVLSECYASGMHGSLLRGLLEGWPCAIFSATGKSLASVHSFLSFLMGKNRGSDFVEVDRATDVLLREIFGVVTYPQNCDLLHQCLSEMHGESADAKSLTEAENLRFLASCVRILKFHCDVKSGLGADCLLGIIRKLTESVQRAATWSAWKKLLSVEPDLARGLIQSQECEDGFTL